MDVLYFKMKLMILFTLCALCLFSCEGNNISFNKNSQIYNDKNKKDFISKVASDTLFLNKLHEIRNPKTNTIMIVKGDGTIVLKTMDPNNEQIGIIEDVDENTNNYIYKTFTGENIEERIYDNGESEFVSTDLTTRAVFYDKDGREIGLTANTYGATYSSKYKIIYRDNSISNSDNDMKVYDVDTKEIQVLPYRSIYTFNGQFLLSTESYVDDDDLDEVIIVCDDNLDEIRRIEGYSVNGVQKRKENTLVFISKRIKDSNNENEYTRKYNFLDSNYDFVFDEDVDDVTWGDGVPVITVKVGNMVYDYDYSEMKKISSERPYVEEKTKWNILQDEKSKYEENKYKIQNTGDQYDYVSIFYYGGEVLYLAYEEMGYDVEDSICDVYNDKLEKIASFDNIDNQYDEEGYIFANKDTVYNEKLERVMKFDEKCHIERIEKFDKVFFANSMEINYSKKKDFELYDKDFNLILNHIDSVDYNTYKDYIVIADENNTTFYDKDMKAVKVLTGRSLDINGWYNDSIGYKAFVDLKTERMGIIDKDFNIVVDNIKYIGNLYADYFAYQNGFKYGFMDYVGIPILTYSIFDTMREDAVEKDFNGNFVFEY